MSGQFEALEERLAKENAAERKDLALKILKENKLGIKSIYGYEDPRISSIELRLVKDSGNQQAFEDLETAAKIFVSETNGKVIAVAPVERSDKRRVVMYTEAPCPWDKSEFDKAQKCFDEFEKKFFDEIGVEPLKREH